MIFGTRRKAAQTAEPERPSSAVELLPLSEGVVGKAPMQVPPPTPAKPGWRDGKFDGTSKAPIPNAPVEGESGPGDGGGDGSASSKTPADRTLGSIAMPPVDEAQPVNNLRARVAELQNSIDGLLDVDFREGESKSANDADSPVSLANAWSEISAPRVMENGGTSVGETGVGRASTVAVVTASAGAKEGESELPERAELSPEDFDDVDRSTQTLKFAQNTADAVIADARAQAQKIVSDAERQRKEIIRRSREQAEHDFGAERDRSVAAAERWKTQRVEILEQLESLSAVFGRYHDGVVNLDETLLLAAREMRGELPVSASRIDDPVDSGSAAVPDEPESGSGDAANEPQAVAADSAVGE